MSAPLLSMLSSLFNLEIDSTDANSNAGLSEALGEQNVHVLQNQVWLFIAYVHSFPRITK